MMFYRIMNLEYFITILIKTETCYVYSKECIWSLLTGLLTQSNSPRIIQYIKEIETWILRLLSSPVPVPGKTKLEVR